MTDLIERVRGLTGPDRRIVDRLDMSGDCWLWTGALDERRRGRVWHNGRLKLHHRAVWEILVGPVPTGALLCHHCDNPQCANPDHIYVGDSQTNVDDMLARRRHWTTMQPEKAAEVARRLGRKAGSWTSGRKNPKAKLSPEQVAAIRDSNDGSRSLGRKYGVDRTTIQRIRKGALWQE